MDITLAYSIICIGLLFIIIGAFFLFRYSTYLTVTPKALLVSSAFITIGFVVWGLLFLFNPTLRPHTLEYLLIVGSLVILYLLWELFMLKLRDKIINWWNNRN
jgi:hypothetical protein